VQSPPQVEGQPGHITAPTPLLWIVGTPRLRCGDPHTSIDSGDRSIRTTQENEAEGLAMLDAEHWRKRAEQMRRIAEDLEVLALAKASVLRNAEEYDRLAARAEKHEDVNDGSRGY